MVSLDWQLGRVAGVTLVELALTSDVTVHVTVESQLQPVWPPRERGRPAAGWTETGFEGVVEADGRLVLGYASPADAVEPPATVVGTEPVDEEAADRQPSAEALVRSLGGAGPPRDAVPLLDGSGPPAEQQASGEQTGDAGTASRTSGSSQDRVTGRNDRGRNSPESDPSPDGPTREGESGTAVASEPPVEGGTDRQEPGAAVDAWLDAVERRLETAERLAAADTAAEAQAAVDAAGGIDAVRALCDDLEADERRLGAVGGQHGQLRERIAAVEIPLSALERLA